MFDGVNFNYLLAEGVIQENSYPRLSFQETLFVKLLEGIKDNRVGYGVIKTQDEQERGVIVYYDPDTQEQIILGYIPNRLYKV